MKTLRCLVLVLAGLLLTSCAGGDWYSAEMTDEEIEMHYKIVNELEPAAGGSATLNELMMPRASVLDFLE